MKRLNALLLWLAATAPALPRADAIELLPAYGPAEALSPGFVVYAQDRFDPVVQRLMAEHSLKALPLRGGQLFYLVPVDVDPHLEEMQIRYLELLLRAADEPLNDQP